MMLIQLVTVLNDMALWYWAGPQYIIPIISGKGLEGLIWIFDKAEMSSANNKPTDTWKPSDAPSLTLS